MLGKLSQQPGKAFPLVLLMLAVRAVGASASLFAFSGVILLFVVGKTADLVAETLIQWIVRGNGLRLTCEMPSSVRWELCCLSGWRYGAAWERSSSALSLSRWEIVPLSCGLQASMPMVQALVSLLMRAWPCGTCHFCTSLLWICLFLLLQQLCARGGQEGKVHF